MDRVSFRVLLEPSREPRSRAPELPVSGHHEIVSLTVLLCWSQASSASCLETADVSSRPNWIAFSFSNPKTTLH